MVARKVSAARRRDDETKTNSAWASWGTVLLAKRRLPGDWPELLGEDRVTHICADDYHKYDRTERARLKITRLHPDCNYLDILELHLERAHYGQPMLKPVYDHSTGSLVRPEYLEPASS